MTNPVNGVAAGQELWFSNAGRRNADGTTETRTQYTPGQVGQYWSSTQGSTTPNAYILEFFTSFTAGRLSTTANWTGGSKLWAIPIRCVR